MRSLQYLSDLHIDRFPIGKFFSIKAQSPNILICGDIGNPKHKNYSLFLEYLKYNFDKTYIVPGNHEYNTSSCFSQKQYDIHKPYLDELYYKYGINRLDCNYYNLSNDTIIAGSTLWSHPDYDNSRRMRYSTYLTHINKHKEEKEWIINLINKFNNKKIIMATHFPPTSKLIENKFYDKYTNQPSKWFYTDLDNLIDYPIIAWICGHTHSICEKKINNVICSVNVDINPKFIYY